MHDTDSTKEALHRPCLHPAGVIRLLRAIAKRQEDKAKPPKTWWDRFKDMWRTL
jgi:hypothetical protein